jgi:glycosyltransferase involved in cell wall biosynthesis
MVNLMTELADHIVVSTPTLMEDVGKQWKTTIAPNLMEVGAYGCPTVSKDDGRLTISWIGAAAHKGDLQLIDRACNRIAKDYKDRVKFHFVGAGPDDTLRDNWGSNCHLTEWFPLVHYWDVLRQIRPHIVLAPLADCRFNWCKSNIRCLEAHCLNSALIYTPLAEYGAANVPNVTGLPATTEDEWYDAMALLIEDSTLREEVATNGHRQVCDEWNWESPNARQKWGYTMDAIERTNWK